MKKIQAFSVAEAMVTLLIVSIALSAIAPIFSKRNTAALNGVSKWMYTRNGDDITRQSKVGIGLPVSTNPDSMLTISSNNDNFVSIKKGSNEVFKIDANGTVTINIQNSPNRALSIQQNGTETAYITPSGGSSFAVPSGAIMFFDLDSCPLGWTALSSTYANASGAFLRNIGETGRTRGSFQAASLPNIKGQILPYGVKMYASGPMSFGEAKSPFLGVTGAVGYDGYVGGHQKAHVHNLSFDASRSANIYQDDAPDDVIPKNLAFLACRKN